MIFQIPVIADSQGDTTPPSAPGLVTIGITSTSGYDLTIPIVTDPSSPVEYELSRAAIGSSSFSVVQSFSTDRTYSQTGMSAGTGYRWRSRARDSAGNTSGYSSIRDVYSLPSAPSLSVSSTTSTSATLNIGSVTGGNAYELNYKESTSGTWILWSNSLSSGNETITGLLNFTLYDFRARAANNNGSWGAYTTITNQLVS